MHSNDTEIDDDIFLKTTAPMLICLDGFPLAALLFGIMGYIPMIVPGPAIDRGDQLRPLTRMGLLSGGTFAFLMGLPLSIAALPLTLFFDTGSYALRKVSNMSIFSKNEQTTDSVTIQQKMKKSH